MLELFFLTGLVLFGLAMVVEMAQDVNWPEFWKTEPIWRSGKMQGESMLLIQDKPGEPAWSGFLFPLGELEQVQMANRSMVFEQGRDFEIDRKNNRLILAEGSRMPWKKLEDFFPIEGEQRSILQFGGVDRAVWHIEDTVYHDLQVEVTYRHGKSDWQGPKPVFHGDKLPKTIKRLADGQPFKAVLYGDSISCGGNASGHIGAAPHMPFFGPLAVECLKNRYGCKIDFANCSEGGMATPWGLENIDRVRKEKPDLAIIAWGMNDASERIPAVDYAGYTVKQMDAIRQVNPDVEFVLVATMTANPDWVHYAGNLYFDYLKALQSLSGPGVAVADVTSVWSEMIKHKRFFDVIANGVNHPNDFGHRLYTQVLLSTFMKDYT